MTFAKAKKFPGIALIILAMSVWAGDVAAANAVAVNPTDRGAQVAQRWCFACHVVSKTPPGKAADVVPIFSSIARMRSRAQIIAKLHDPHGSMPTDALTEQDINDVTAYIESLK